MESTSFHKHFQLNGLSFKDDRNVLDYSKTISKELSVFLQDWFSTKEFVIVNTSGSTGKPKPIKLQKKNMINSAIASGNYFELPSRTTALLCLPIEYIAGKMMLIRALTLGWHLDVIKSSSSPLKNTTKSYDFVAMVPLQLENSIDKLHTIKTLIVGGGVVSYKLQQKLKNVSTAIFATYGMTETITHVAVKKLNNHKEKEAFYKVLPNVTIYVDERNCLVIKADNVSKEIVVTNDVVQLISTNSFKWLGRFDNVINSGGIKLQPEKIEEKLQPYLSQRFFISSLPDDKLGEKIVLIIEGIDDNALGNAIKNLLRYEKPKEIYCVSKFKETKTQKIDRKKTLSLIFKDSK